MTGSAAVDSPLEEFGAHDLVGREREVERIGALIDRASGGSGSVLVVEGDPGIGKSSVLSALARAAQQRSFEVLVGRGEELGAGRPFGPFAEALGLSSGSDDPDAAAVGRILEGREPSAPVGLPMTREARFHVLDRIIGLLSRMTDTGPAVLILDDLQWADDDTLFVLGALSARVGDTGLVVAAAARRPPRPATVTTALRSLIDEGAEALALEPLEPSSVDLLVERALGATPGPRLLAGAARAEGNPFLVLEIVQGHATRGLRELPDGSLDAVDDDVPESGRDAVLRRVDALPPDVVEVLRIATALGRSFDADALAEIAQLTRPTLLRVIGAALEAGVLVESGPRLSFAHDLVREAVYSSIPQSLRSSLHVAAARALAGGGADPFDVATQYALAEPVGEEAVEWLVRAGEHTRLAAPATASAFFERALADLDPDDPRRPGIQGPKLYSLVFSGRLTEVEPLADRWITAIHDPPLRASIQYSIGQALFLQGRLEEAAARFEAAGADAPDPGRVLADTAFTLLLGGELERARDAAERAISAATRDGDVVGHTAALCAQSWIVSFLGEYEAGHRLARQAVEEADAAGTDEPHRNLPYLFYAQVLLWQERDCEARQALDRATRIGHRLGLVWDAPLRQLLRARLLFRSGSWDDAVAEAEAGLSYARDLGGSLADVWLECLLARMAVQRRDLAEADRRLHRASHGVDAGAQGADQAYWMQGLALEAAGEIAAARDLLALVWAELDTRDLPYFLVDLAPDLVRVARRCDDDHLVASVLERVRGIASEDDDPLFAAVAARCAGIVGDDPDALADAEARHLALSGDARPIDLAILRMERAAALEGCGRPDEAGTLAAVARAVLDPLGVEPFLVRAVPRPAPTTPEADDPRSPTAEASGGPEWDRLTRSERRVVALVGEGLSNVEIADRLGCSRRTVESHLHHAYTKVGVESRVQLAVHAARLAGSDTLTS